VKTKFKRLILNLLITLLIVVTGLVVLEAGSRVVWKRKYNELLEKSLHGFDHVDYKRSILVPNANTRTTVEKHRDDLTTLGKTLGLKYFEESIQRDAPPGSVVLFTINKYGFKGPEIAVPKPDSIFRILTIGNSCTWGPPNDYYTYPRTMERELNRLVDQQYTVEVVNAGVFGYNFESVIKRIDEFLAVEPDLITIYIGWNRTIHRADPAKNLYLYRHFSLYKIFYHFILNRTDTGFEENHSSKTFYDENDPELEGFKNYSFKYDIKDLDRLVKIIQKKDTPIKVIVITLAGIFDIEVSPDTQALQVAYPIASTNNLYVYSILTQKYNAELKKYAQEHQLNIIDFETYARTNFVPRSAYFKDATHPSIDGYLKMGKYFANKLVNFIALRND